LLQVPQPMLSSPLAPPSHIVEPPLQLPLASFSAMLPPLSALYPEFSGVFPVCIDVRCDITTPETCLWNRRTMSASFFTDSVVRSA
jgi:hypothetical protein